MDVVPRSLIVFWTFFGFLCLLPLLVVFLKGTGAPKEGGEKTLPKHPS